MKKLMTLTLACLMLASSALQTGCSTASPEAAKAAQAAAQIPLAYYAQTNVAEILHIEGTNLTFTVSGATKFVLSTPVPPKSIIPRDVSWYDGAFDMLKSVAPWLVFGFMLDNGGFGNSKTTTTTNN